MKQFHLSTRVAALMLALVMLVTMTACGGTKPADDGASSSAAETKVPAFINSLPDVDLEAIAQPQLPDADLLAKLNTAYNQNNDVAAWLQVPDTTIDNEVIHYTDNDYYLRRDITKAYNWYGCYFADYEGTFGDRNSISKNTIIYGHSMDDNPEGLQFSQLKKYTDKDFAASHPYIYLSTPEDNMVWKVFSVMYTDEDLEYIYPNRQGAEFMALTSELKDRSKFDFDVDVNASDKILTLSTCTYVYGSREDQRFVVTARLVRPGEKMDPTVKVEVNPDVKPPQFK